jgi:hypothetical protein
VQNTRQLMHLQTLSEKSASSLEILQYIFAGLLAFSVLDRITGEWSVMDQTWMKDFADPMISETPILWFLFNLVSVLAHPSRSSSGRRSPTLPSAHYSTLCLCSTAARSAECASCNACVVDSCSCDRSCLRRSTCSCAPRFCSSKSGRSRARIRRSGCATKSLTSLVRIARSGSPCSVGRYVACCHTRVRHGDVIPALCLHLLQPSRDQEGPRPHHPAGAQPDRQRDARRQRLC